MTMKNVTSHANDDFLLFVMISPDVAVKSVPGPEPNNALRN